MPAIFHEYHLSSLTRSSVCRYVTHPLPACDAGARGQETMSCLLTLAFPPFLVLVDQHEIQAMRPSPGPDQRWCPRLSGRLCHWHHVPAWYRSSRQAPQWGLALLSFSYSHYAQGNVAAFSTLTPPGEVHISVPLYHTIPHRAGFQAALHAHTGVRYALKWLLCTICVIVNSTTTTS